MGKRARENTQTEESANNNNNNAAGASAVDTTATLGVYSSNAPSAHSIGITAMALREKEDRMVVAREDGSLAVCAVRPNIVRFTANIVPMIRTGSYQGRTVTRILYALGGTVIVASYLSGQVVVHDEATLTPLHVAERAGGAIWDMISLNRNGVQQKAKKNAAPATNAAGQAIVSSGDNAAPAEGPARDAPVPTEEEFVCACSDGSWYHFNLTRKPNNTFSFDLIQVFPKVVGAHRALSIQLCGNMLVGGDDCGNIVAWSDPGKGTRGYNQLWLTRLPKGAYAKSIAYDAETNYIAVGTSLGDMAFIKGERGTIANVYTNHQGPITTVISAGSRTFLATGWHESLRAYRFVEKKWIPSEVKRRTHYHEATQLLHLPSANAVIGSSRDGTLLIASLMDNFNSPAKYSQPVPQLYAYAADASVVLTVAGDRVEFYQGNEIMSHWSPLACYSAHGQLGISGVWCNSNLTRVIVATTTRLVILACQRKSTSSITLSKITDFPFANVHALVMRGDKDCYLVHGLGKLTHLSFGASASSAVIAEHIDLPIRGTSLNIVSPPTTNAVSSSSTDETAAAASYIIVASYVQQEQTVKIPLHPDGSFATNTPTPFKRFQADIIISNPPHVGLAMSRYNFIDISGEEYTNVVSSENNEEDNEKGGEEAAEDGTAAASPSKKDKKKSKRQINYDEEVNGKRLPPSIPADTVFFKKIYDGHRPMWIGSSPRGLLIATHNSWWMADEEHRKPKEIDAETLNRSTAVAVANGPRTTFVAAFAAEDSDRVLVLRRDIESEVETLPLMWKVRRFGN